jgi:hypothetical protein
MDTTTRPTVRLSDLERRHRAGLVRPPTPPTWREVCISTVAAALVTPWVFATFGVIPIIGQALFAAVVVLLGVYLYSRRSLSLTAGMVGAPLTLVILFMASAQMLKYRLEVPLFLLVATGIPVTVMAIVALVAMIWLRFSPEQFEPTPKRS